jgi:transposase
MKLYGGIDLHSNNNVVVLSNEEDQEVYKRRLPNVLDMVLGELAPHREGIQGLVVESTYNWYWLVDGLMEAGYRVHLANTVAIQQYSGLKYADDDDDAAWLAHLLRLGVLKEGYICPKEQRMVRDVARERMRLVHEHTAHLLSIQGLFARNTGHSVSANDLKKLSFEDVDRQIPEPLRSLPIKTQLRVMERLRERIEALEIVLEARVRPLPQFRCLKTVAGVGDILGLTILLETGDIGRFPKVGQYASYCRCVDSKHLSNGKKKGKGNTKNGNKYLAWAFVEAANFAVRYNAKVRRFYQRKAAETNRIVATKAVAHKLARATYYVLRDQVKFNVDKAFV